MYLVAVDDGHEIQEQKQRFNRQLRQRPGEVEILRCVEKADGDGEADAYRLLLRPTFN